MNEETQKLTIEEVVVITTSNNNMEAFITFTGLYDGLITVEKVYEIIKTYNIKYGVDSVLVRKVLDEYKKNPSACLNKEYLIARGIPMKPGRDGYIEFYISENAPVSIDESGKADFRNIEKFHTVQEGQKLARLHKMIKGTAGYNIFAEEIKPNEVTDVNIKLGSNVHFNSENEIISDKMGIYNKIRNVISVSEVLAINGNVGLESGNLQYAGVIKIGGGIERGAEVRSNNDIYVSGLVESGHVKSGGSFNVSGGINTKNEGVIEAENGVNSSFIENSTIISEGPITVVSSIIASAVSSYSHITLLKEGNKIVGGELLALEYIAADVIGNQNETPTIIHLGTHPKFSKLYDSTLKELQFKEGKFSDYVEKIREIKEYITRMHGKITDLKKIEFKKIFDDYKELESEINELKKQLEIYKVKRYYKDNVYLHVRDTLFPGVVVHYFNITEKISQIYKHCSLKFIRSEARWSLETYSGPALEQQKK